MPGAFPGTSIPSLSTSRNHDNSQNFPSPPVELPPQLIFEQKEQVGAKTAAQRHLLGQFNSLTYFIIGYQFVKYCYSSSLPPLFLHAIIQQLLHIDEITDRNRSFRTLFSDVMSAQERHAELTGVSFDRRAWAHHLESRLTHFIYWKFLVVAVMHILFVVVFLQGEAGAGRLSRLSFGLWYCLSFMGEIGPSNYLMADPWWLRLWKLGLVELLACDLAILVLQLCVFQSVYVQLTISPRGIALGEEEVNILRVQGGVRGDVEVDLEGRMDILHIKLFQLLERDAYM